MTKNSLFLCFAVIIFAITFLVSSTPISEEADSSSADGVECHDYECPKETHTCRRITSGENKQINISISCLDSTGHVLSTYNETAADSSEISFLYIEEQIIEENPTSDEKLINGLDEENMEEIINND